MSATMNSAAPKVWSRSLRRLSLLASLLAAFAFSIIFTMMVPLRVGECGPPDPYLLRYLGTPFFHATGYGTASSLEATIWAGPFLANIAIVAAVIFGLNTLNNRRPLRRARRQIAPRPRIYWGVIGLSAVLILGSSWMIVEAHNVLWTLASPEVTAASCDIRFDPFTVTDAWVRPADE